MRIEANCLLRWHEHDLNARVAADVSISADDCYVFKDDRIEVLQHDGPASVDGEELMESTANDMSAGVALAEAYEKAVKT